MPKRVERVLATCHAVAAWSRLSSRTCCVLPLAGVFTTVWAVYYVSTKDIDTDVNVRGAEVDWCSTLGTPPACLGALR